MANNELTHIPTGEKFRLRIPGQREVISVHRQTTPDSCGDASLAMLRHPGTGERPEDGGTSVMGVVYSIIGSEDVTDEVLADGYPLGTGTYIEWGRKASTGETHAYVVAAGRGSITVLDPETKQGVSAAKSLADYRKGITEVQAVVKVPMGHKQVFPQSKS